LRLELVVSVVIVAVYASVGVVDACALALYFHSNQSTIGCDCQHIHWMGLVSGVCVDMPTATDQHIPHIPLSNRTLSGCWQLRKHTNTVYRKRKTNVPLASTNGGELTKARGMRYTKRYGETKQHSELAVAHRAVR